MTVGEVLMSKKNKNQTLFPSFIVRSYRNSKTSVSFVWESAAKIVLWSKKTILVKLVRTN